MSFMVPFCSFVLGDCNSEEWILLGSILSLSYDVHTTAGQLYWLWFFVTVTPLPPASFSLGLPCSCHCAPQQCHLGQFSLPPVIPDCGRCPFILHLACGSNSVQDWGETVSGSQGYLWCSFPCIRAFIWTHTCSTLFFFFLPEPASS